MNDGYDIVLTNHVGMNDLIIITNRYDSPAVSSASSLQAAGHFLPPGASATLLAFSLPYFNALLLFVRIFIGIVPSRAPKAGLTFIDVGVFCVSCIVVPALVVVLIFDSGVILLFPVANTPHY